MMDSLINFILPTPSARPARLSGWKTLRVFEHTFNALVVGSRSERMTVPQFLDYMLDRIEELEEEIKNLKRSLSECKGNTS